MLAESWSVGGVSTLFWLVPGVSVVALAFVLSRAKGCKPVVVCQQGSAHCQRVLEECPVLRNRWVTPIVFGKVTFIIFVVFELFTR